MDNKEMQNNKQNGIYYTPSALAEYLVAPLIKCEDISILDPAYGEGSLLLSAEKIYYRKINKNGLHLFGCDIKPVNGLLEHLPKANLKKADFLNYPMEEKVDLVLMNPPYVRHHFQDKKKVKEYRAHLSDFDIINNSADLWAYFMIKSVHHLKKGGSIGAVLPWAFLKADYAQPLRSWLSRLFSDIKILTLSDQYFDNAEERVVLVWLKDYGTPTKSIKIASANSIKGKISFSNIPLENWNSNKVLYNGNTDTNSILLKYKNEYGFSELENYAEIKIGVVTAADTFFIKSEADAKALGFSKIKLLPILTSSKDFTEVIINGAKNLKRLIILKEKDYSRFKDYVEAGVLEKYNLRAHSKLRKPWYSVRVGKIPDAFFPYRAVRYPYLLVNDFKIQCTNSVHRVYFKNLTDTEVRWIQVSLLSVIGQLSLEANSRTYGNGVLKVEPKSLKKALVLKRNDASINPVFIKITKQLKNNNKEAAVRMATEFINSQLDIPKKLEKEAAEHLLELQNLRHSSP